MSAEAHRTWRDGHPEYRENEKRRNAAARRALSRLKALHPDEYRAIYAEECEAGGVELRPRGRPARLASEARARIVYAP